MLEYNFHTGLNNVYFEFTSQGGIGLTHDAVLVIMDPDSNVIGVVDPFDPDHPNKLLPPIPKTYGEVPLVTARPTATDNLKFTEEQMALKNLHSKEYFDKIKENSDRVSATYCGGGTEYGEHEQHATESCWGTERRERRIYETRYTRWFMGEIEVIKEDEETITETDRDCNLDMCDSF
jgi:hypothetical protein